MRTLTAFLCAFFLIYSCSKSEIVAQNTSENVDIDFTYAPINNMDSANFYVLKAKFKDKYTSLTWTFGDNEVSQNEPNVSHYYPKKGSYDIKLTTIDMQGKTLATIKTVVVENDDPKYVPYKLIWSDEFNGNTLDANNWINETNIDVNNELQRYTNGDNLTIKDGILTITAKKVGSGQQKYDYTSGRINSNGKKTFLYGRFEFRAKLPAGKGTWPATWMLGSNIGSVGWPACGELDVMEHVGYDPYFIQGSIHTPSSYGQTINNGRLRVNDCETTFHTYGMTWTPSKIEYYIDDPNNPYYTYNPSVKNASTWPFDKPCFLIINLAVGGNWGGAQGVDDSVFPASMQIDYVRVYNYK